MRVISHALLVAGGLLVLSVSLASGQDEAQPKRANVMAAVMKVLSAEPFARECSLDEHGFVVAPPPQTNDSPALWVMLDGDVLQTLTFLTPKATTTRATLLDACNECNLKAKLGRYTLVQGENDQFITIQLSGHLNGSVPGAEYGPALSYWLKETMDIIDEQLASLL